MRRYGRILTIIILPLSAALVFAFWPEPAEPEYEGRKLGAVLEDLITQGRPTTPESPLVKTIQGMGTNGIPFYLEKLRYKPSLIEEIASLLREESENRLRRKKFRRWGAIEAFRILGERGEPAIPKLVHYASSTREPIAQECAFKCLACIGQPAMPALAALMTNSVPRVRLLALRQSISFGTNALIAVQLARLESDPDRDVRIKAVKREQSQAQARR